MFTSFKVRLPRLQPCAASADGKWKETCIALVIVTRVRAHGGSNRQLHDDVDGSDAYCRARYTSNANVRLARSSISESNHSLRALKSWNGTSVMR